MCHPGNACLDVSHLKRIIVLMLLFLSYFNILIFILTATDGDVTAPLLSKCDGTDGQKWIMDSKFKWQAAKEDEED